MTIADHKFVIYLFIACTAATLTAYLQHLHLRSPPFANNRIRFEHSSPSAGTDSIIPTSSSATMSFSYHDDYKAFVFAQHPTHGLLLLYCTRKKKKPNHFQAQGGHVDEADFDEAKQLEQSKNEGGPVDILVKACTIGAARELFEETGIDLRSSLDRYLNTPVVKCVIFFADINVKYTLNYPFYICIDCSRSDCGRTQMTN